MLVDAFSNLDIDEIGITLKNSSKNLNHFPNLVDILAKEKVI